jgi:hypothetical protein
MVDPLQSLPGTSGTTSGSAFVSEFDPSMHTLLFFTYFNGPQSGSRVSGLAMDTQGRAHVTGTGMDDLPTTSSAYLRSVTPPPQNYTYNYGFAALIDPTLPGPGICFSNEGTTAQVGTSSQASFTVTNCGNAPLNISNVQLMSPIFALSLTSSCVGTLSAGNSCTITAIFTPTSAGNYGASVVITSNATVPVYNVAISGYATAPTISLLPTSLIFSSQVLGVNASDAPLQVLAVNNGTAPLIVDPSGVTITGDFSIVSDNCGSPIPTPSSPQNTFDCVIAVAFQPTALGLRTGTLTLTSNDPVHPTVTVPLSGTAIAAYSTPAITGLSVTAVALGISAATLHVEGTNFFPTSYVVINGEPHPTTYQNGGTLAVTIDPSLLTVVGELPVWVVNPSPGGQSAAYPLTVFQALPVSAAGLAYNSVTHMLYASIPANAASNANTILPIDPLTGKPGTPIPVGNDPATLALSDDGTYLYVALNGDHTLQRVNLTTSLVERTFPLPIDTLVNAATTVMDMHVVPGSPQSVVVSLSRNASPSEAGAALFTDSGLASFLNNDNSPPHPYDSFTFTSDPTKFYSYPFGSSFFGIMGVSSTTLSPLVQGGFSCCNQTTGSIAVSDGSLLYTNSGQVWNPTTSTLLGTYPGSLFYEPSIVADSGMGRTYILDAFGYNSLRGVSVLSFNPSNYSFAGSVSLPVSLAPAPANLLRWGADGFAFRVYGGSAYGDASDQILILRGSIAHTATGGTPALSSLSPATAAPRGPTFELTVNGSSFIPGSVVLWNSSPRQTTYVSATQLVALIPSSDIATAAAAQVVVTNPAPGGSSPAITFNIGPPASPQTINFPAPISPVSLGTAPITLSATSTSSLPVTFSVTGPATLTGNTLQFTGAGTVVVTARQAGNNSYTAAPAVSRTIVVSQATPMISLISSANPVLVQNAVTFSATISSAVGAPTGTVSFLDGNTALGSVALNSGGATFTTSALSAGSHQITAVYSGDANFVTLTSAPLTENVQDFSLNIAPSSGASISQTVSPGGTATYPLTLSPMGSTFPAAVTLTVSGLPAGASYTLTPTTIATGAGATNVTLTIQVPAKAASLKPHEDLSRGLIPTTLGFLLLPLLGRLRRSAEKLNGIVSIALLVLAGVGATVCLVGCGAKDSSPSEPTAQNYTIAVTGTSGTLVHTTNLTLTVK